MLIKELIRVFIHLRWPLQVFTILGFVFGLMIAKVSFSSVVIIAFISSFFLNFGITLFNSYYDNDNKPVAGLRNPPKVTKSLLFGSLFFKIISLMLALFVNLLFFSLIFLAVLLSVLYSHKNFRFKSNGFIALLFNFFAGFITFLSASSISSFELVSYNIILGAFSSGLFLVSIYLMMSIHQTKDDALRGDNSYALMFGRDKSVISSIFILIIAGLLSLISLYLSNLFLHIIILSFYMFLGLILVTIWFYIKEQDFRIMSIITNYFSFTGSIIMILLYFLF